MSQSEVNSHISMEGTNSVAPTAFHHTTGGKWLFHHGREEGKWFMGPSVPVGFRLASLLSSETDGLTQMLQRGARGMTECGDQNTKAPRRNSPRSRHLAVYLVVFLSGPVSGSQSFQAQYWVCSVNKTSLPMDRTR